MLRTFLQKRAKVIAPIFILLVLSLFLTAIASAETTFIEAGKSGRVVMQRGVKLRILRNALEEDTLISAEMVITEDQVDFIFGPSPLSLNVPALLKISWGAAEDLGLDGSTLIGPYGEEIEPSVDDWGMIWEIPHFSLYYHRRR